MPPEQRLPTWDWQRFVLGLSLTLLFFMIGFYLYNLWQIKQAEERIATIRTNYALLRPAEEKMLAVQAKQQMLRNKQDILIRLTKERISAYAVLAQFGRITPEHIRLLGLQSKSPNIIQVTGVAPSYPDLAAFLAQLEQDNLFTSPALVEVEQITTPAATKFVLTIKLKEL